MGSMMYPLRKDVPKEQTWNSKALFADWDAWKKELENALAAIPRLKSFAGRLSDGPEVVAEWFAAYENQMRKINRLQVYVSLSTAVDASDAAAKGARGQLGALMGQVGAAAAFADPEMQAFGEILLEWTDQHPKLRVYRQYFLNLLRERPHTRSQEVEEILGMLAETFGNISTTSNELTNSDIKFPPAVDSHGKPHPVAQATITPTGIQSSDRERRKTAWNSFADAHLAMKNTLASNYITHVKSAVFQARVRGYGSVLESRLSPSNLPVDVFHTLMETFQANIPTWHRYWEVKQKVLGVDSIRPYDIWAPIVNDEPVVSFEESVEWISAGLEPLGDEYLVPMRRGCLDERWVDYAQNLGKRQGAFSTRSIGGNYPYVFMTFDGSLMGLSVLAHELGHSMHSYLAAEKQSPVYMDYRLMSSTVTETASNFNQAMLRSYLLKEKVDDINFQVALIDEAMFNFHRYFFQMPLLARFELDVYTRAEKGKPLTADILNGIMKELYSEGYGSTMTDDPERTSITWAQFMHLFAPFYTFQYAVGISAAHALAERVLNQPDAAQDYLAFLRAGASRYPMDLFGLGGIDMTSPEPIEKTFAILASLVDRLEKLKT